MCFLLPHKQKDTDERCCQTPLRRFLEGKAVFKAADLLKFVDTHHDAHVFGFSNFLRQCQNLFCILLEAPNLKLNAEIRHRISPDGDLRPQPRQKMRNGLRPLLPPTGSCLDNGSGIGTQKFRLVSTGKRVKGGNPDVIRRREARNLLHQGGFPLASKR